MKITEGIATATSKQTTNKKQHSHIQNHDGKKEIHNYHAIQQNDCKIAAFNKQTGTYNAMSIR